MEARDGRWWVVGVWSGTDSWAELPLAALRDVRVEHWTARVTTTVVPEHLTW